MTKAEVLRMIDELKRVFKIVRLVDDNLTVRFYVNSKGELKQTCCRCYEVWNKDGRCENCITSKALSQKAQMAKFEFLGHDVYYVIAKYIEMDGVPYIMEMINIVDDETLFDAHGHDKFAMRIASYSQKIYTDPMTGAWNRRYLEEQYHALNLGVAVAMLDVDNFKGINDTFGHHAGDEALREIGKTILSKIRKEDKLVRYGGDEFLLAFAHISKEVFLKRLETIREAVSEIVIGEYPEMSLTVSIGGVYRTTDGALDMAKEADKVLYQSKLSKNQVIIVLK